MQERLSFEREMEDLRLNKHEIWRNEVSLAHPPKNRGSVEYIRWAQSVLNRSLDLKLAINGMLDQKTLSAIRSFQRRNGLAADGIMGPKTEKALLASSGAGPGCSGIGIKQGYCIPLDVNYFGSAVCWDAYKFDVKDLDKGYKNILIDVGNTILDSHCFSSSECQKVNYVDIEGNADLNTPRDSKYEQWISDKRAASVEKFLMNWLGNDITNKITWFRRGLGATNLIFEKPTTEEQRKQNRRVDMRLSASSEM